ncbi:MAG TPA: long-chain fatty acid--CoA ligase [Polyangiaceae bacterium]|nr:long-chain fatty acid--CoA ligase [Polyangiaceae bacterium]
MNFTARHRTLVDIFSNSVREFGPRPLFGTKTASGWSWTTYAEFGSQVERLRSGLAALGVRPGDRVAVVSNNRVEWAVTAYASYALGAAIVPMYAAQHPREWEFILRDSEAKALFVADGGMLAGVSDRLQAIPALEHVIVFDGAPAGGPGARTYASLLDGRAAAALARPAPGDTAGLIYTSGTTGNPKGVILTHDNIASNVCALQELVPKQDDDRSLSFLPWAHVFGQTVELHGLLSVGASMAICDRVDRILEDLAEVRPTILMSVPRVFNKIYTAVEQQIASKPQIVQRMVARALKVAAKERAGERLTLRELALLRFVDRTVFEKVRARLGGRLRHAASGGAALSKHVAEFIDAVGIQVFEGYGLTETSPVATTNVPGARKFGSVGRPIPGVRVEIDVSATDGSRADGDAQDRREGEIVVYGHNVMQGYLKRPDENAAVFTHDGGFRTGDMGYLDAHGFLFITGRIKEQYKLENGKYVVPTPLEEQLKLSPYVDNVMVYGANRPHNVAIVVANVPAVRRWAEQRRTALADDADAVLRDGRVRALFAEEIARLGAEFRRFEQIADFALVATDFTTENGLLTPSMKLKRAAVVERYRSLIESLYAPDRAHERAPSDAPGGGRPAAHARAQ